MRELKNYKRLIAGGTIAIALALILMLLTLFNNRVQAAEGSTEDGNQQNTLAVPMSEEQENEESQESQESQDRDEGTDGGETNIRINDTRMRWNGEKWEYSTDGGNTWSDTPPDGVNVDEEGNMNIWQGEGDIEDFDIDAFMQEVDDMIASIQSEIEERYGDILPEGAEAGSFFTYGDSIARQVEGVWEFSSDGGETWTNDPPDGIEVSEDGTRFRISGGEDNIEDFDADTWLEEWYNEWYNENSNTITGQEISV